MPETSSGQALLNRLDALKTYRPQTFPSGDHRDSAVLIPIRTEPTPTLIYTLRAQHLKHHPGQISFPGGRIEAGETSWQAALREAHEEIGLEPERVAYLGQIDDVLSPRGFHVTCFVGSFPSFEPAINHDEVERLVEVDLNELFDEERHREQPWGMRHRVHYFDFREGTVWGVTGQITLNLRDLATRDRHPAEP